MSTEVKEKINTKPLMECLEALPDKKIEELYDKVLDITGEKKHKKASREEKIEYAASGILAEYMSSLILLNKEEINEIEKRIHSSKTNKIEQDLIDNNYIFEIDGKYFIPEELKEIFARFNSKKVDSSKKGLLMSYYILVNGLLKIETLIDLMQKSSYNVTKKEIITFVKKENYIIEDNIIYLSKIVKIINKNNELLELKETSKYKIVDMGEAMLELAMLKKINPHEKISSFLNKKVKNKDKCQEISEFIYNIICLNEDFEENLDNLLNEYNINLNEDELDELYDILEGLCHVLPSWSLNGYTPHELYCNEIEDYDVGSFEDLPDDDKKEIYIINYVTINGIIKIDKLVDLLTNNHQLKTNKKEIIKIVKDNSIDDDVCVIDDYICTTNFDKENFEWIKSLKKSDNYKVIRDVDELINELEDNDINFDIICENYNIDENIKDELRSLLTIGILNENILLMTLNKNSHTIPLKKQNSLYKELKSVINDRRMWILNGYKSSELNSGTKKAKIGRNEKCPCGSGKNTSSAVASKKVHLLEN